MYQQVCNRALLAQGGPDLMVVVDESGDPGLRDVGAPYCFSAVIVEAGQVATLRGELEAGRALWGRNSPREIHFTKVPDRLREKVAAIFARAVSDRVHSVHCYIFDKWDFLKHLLRNHAD